MKKLWIVILLIVCCAALLVACDESDIGTAEITTSKSGSVSVDLFDQTAPADKVGKKDGLTPLVTGTPEKSITDDATGMHRIIIRTQGEGTLTTSTDKATEGETITFTATPATDWRFVSVTVNGQIVQNNGA
ncbi:MAG: hypothetical protein J6036_04125, partial [Clostridia bacterium]|nr:hypothetical protein [Clostridia bacterium]